jgi:hypothetical protein
MQRFSWHGDLRTLQRYDDNRRDLAGKVAKKVTEHAHLALVYRLKRGL